MRKENRSIGLMLALTLCLSNSFALLPVKPGDDDEIATTKNGEDAFIMETPEDEKNDSKDDSGFQPAKVTIGFEVPITSKEIYTRTAIAPGVELSYKLEICRIIGALNASLGYLNTTKFSRLSPGAGVFLGFAADLGDFEGIVGAVADMYHISDTTVQGMSGYARRVGVRVAVQMNLSTSDEYAGSLFFDFMYALPTELSSKKISMNNAALPEDVEANIRSQAISDAYTIIEKVFRSKDVGAARTNLYRATQVAASEGFKYPKREIMNSAARNTKTGAGSNAITVRSARKTNRSIDPIRAQGVLAKQVLAQFLLDSREPLLGAYDKANSNEPGDRDIEMIRALHSFLDAAEEGISSAPINGAYCSAGNSSRTLDDGGFTVRGGVIFKIRIGDQS